MLDNELLDRDTITRVRAGWAKLAPMEPRFTNRLYTELFALDPALKSLFQSDMDGHGVKFRRMVDFAIDKLDDPNTLLPVLQQRGCRHVAYGVESVHYETVGAALMLTLAEALGDDFTDPVREAWTSFYRLMAGIMKQAAYNDV